MRRQAKKREGGYALLVILFVGAVMAIMLALSLPRAAFESQRDKEDDLIYRGGQYARAVQLYFRKFRRYPGSLDDLEKTNNVRFLRRKYVDPITKKEEWRFIHVGPAGVFTDSLVYDKPKPKKEGEGGSTGTNPEAAPAGSTITGMADRLRANAAAQGTPSGPADPNALPPFGQVTGPQQPGQPTYYTQQVQPGQVPGVPYAAPGVPSGMPAGATAGTTIGAPPGWPSATASPAANPAAYGPGGYAAPNQPPSAFGGSTMGTPPFPAAGSAFGGAFGQNVPNPAFPGGPGAAPRSGFPNTPTSIFGGTISSFGGTPTSGVGSPPMSSEAARIIGQLLTTPRPGGLAGLPGVGTAGATGTGAAGGGQFGGGIAGVASKSEARGIKIYHERETYNEWEFVYDYRRDPLIVGAAAGVAGGVPGQPPGSLGQQPNPFGQPGMFGQQPGMFGQQPGSGQQPGGPIMPINPAQPGLPSSPFGPPQPHTRGPR